MIRDRWKDPGPAEAGPCGSSLRMRNSDRVGDGSRGLADVADLDAECAARRDTGELWRRTGDDGARCAGERRATGLTRRSDGDTECDVGWRARRGQVDVDRAGL